MLEETENEKESGNKCFSVISYWDYSEELNNHFECAHAFISKPVLSFNYGFRGTSKTQYLFTSREREGSREREVFFFC